MRDARERNRIHQIRVVVLAEILCYDTKGESSCSMREMGWANEAV